MFRANADPDDSSRNMLQSRNADSNFQLPRRFDFAWMAKDVFGSLMRVRLQPLRHSSGKLSPLLHAGQQRFRDPSLPKRIGQQIRCRHRVLNREVDADSSSWRHGMGGIPDTQQTWLMPLPQAVKLDR